MRTKDLACSLSKSDMEQIAMLDLTLTAEQVASLNNVYKPVLNFLVISSKIHLPLVMRERQSMVFRAG